MCWLSKNHILKNVNNSLRLDNTELNNININLTKINNEYKKELEELHIEIRNIKTLQEKEISTFKNVIQKKDKEIKDIVYKFETITKKKDIIIQDLSTKINEKNEKIKELKPTNKILFYFAGFHKNLPTKGFYDEFKNVFDDIIIKKDDFIHNTLQKIKTNKKLQKIGINRKIIKGSYDEINKYLIDGKKVYLFGENFGGSVINRIIDLYTYKDINSDITPLLNNLYCYTFGSFYNPNRKFYPKSLSHFINENHIYNFLYRNDIVTNYENGTTPKNVLKTKWVSNICRFEKWSTLDIDEPIKINNLYEISTIFKENLIEI